MLRSVKLVVGLLMIVGIAQSSGGAEPAAIGPAPETLSVLYAGKPRSDRMAESVAFLSKHFAKVGTCDVESDIEDQATDYDVVVLDWPESDFVKPGSADQPGPELQPVSFPGIKDISSFKKPLIIMGTTGIAVGMAVVGTTTSRPDLSYFSLFDRAHDSNVNHPIFQGPLQPDILLEQVPQPTNYYLHPGSKEFGATIDAWRIQTKPLVGGTGLNADLFKGLNDYEIISYGLNPSRPNLVSLARNGNVLYWGFSGSVADMTSAAQLAYINAICYMTAFKNKTAEPLLYHDSLRDTFLDQIYDLRRLNDQHFQASIEIYKNSLALISLANAERILNDPSAFFKKQLENRAQWTLQLIPAEVRDMADRDVEKIINYYTENLEYLYLDDQRRFQVDEDAKSLGLSNRSQEFMKRCFEMLDDPKQVTLAKTLIARYVDPAAENSQEWVKFFREHINELSHQADREKFIMPTSLGNWYDTSTLPSLTSNSSSVFPSLGTASSPSVQAPSTVPAPTFRPWPHIVPSPDTVIFWPIMIPQ